MLSDLDQIDRQILYALDINSRQPIADLARQLGMGRDRIAYRIRQLSERGILTKFGATINPYKFGLTAYKTYLRLQNHRSRIASAVSYLSSNPRIYWLAETEGAWDLIFVTLAREAKEFHSMQDDILAEFSDIVVGFSVYTLVDATFYRKRYLVADSSGKFFFGGRPLNIPLDKIDIGLLESLATDSRTSITDLAQQVSVSPMVVKYRIGRLEDLGVITGYRTELDVSKLGMSYFKLLIHLQSYRRGVGDELLHYCDKNPFVTYFIQQIGDCKIEMELDVESYDQLSSMISELRQKFPSLIRSIEPLLVRRQMYRWMPSDILKVEQEKPGKKTKKREKSRATL